MTADNDLQRAEMRVGQNVLLMMDNPPDLGETRDIVIRTRCTATGEEQRKVDGDKTPYRRNVIVTAWELGKPRPPSADEDQPGLYDDGDEQPAGARSDMADEPADDDTAA